MENGILYYVTVSDSDIYAGFKTDRGEGIRQANVRVCISRPLTVGERFESRKGQKCSMSSACSSPDNPSLKSGSQQTFFKPNGFPRHMIIGMMVAAIPGPSGALHGIFNYSTPYPFDECVRTVEVFADELVKAG